MKLIDLLSALYRVNNGSKEMIPKKIKFRSTELNFDKNYNRYVHYSGKTIGELIPLDIFLNEEVEIIGQEKEIEMCEVLEHCVDFSKNENVLLDNQLRLQDKINELIDAVNSINKGK